MSSVDFSFLLVVLEFDAFESAAGSKLELFRVDSHRRSFTTFYSNLEDAKDAKVSVFDMHHSRASRQRGK
jgi:hypothetical protein